MEKHSLSDLLSSAQKVRGLLLQRLESEKSQWLFPEVEWSLYSLHTQRINGCYKSSSCAEQRALLCPSRPAGSPRGHGAATHGCHRRGRVAQCTNAALVAGVTGHCSPGGVPSTLGANNSLSSAHRPPPSSHIVSFPRPGEQNLFHRAPVDQPSGLDALSRAWVEPGKPPEQGLNFVCPCTAPSTPRVPLNTTNNHHALAFNYWDTTTLKLLPISTKQAHMEVRPSTDCHHSS